MVEPRYQEGGGDLLCCAYVGIWKGVQCAFHGSDVVERLRALDSNSCVSDQQSVGSNPSRDTCVLKQDTEPLLRPSDGT